jgi:type I restriction enzyme M protein
VLFVNAENLFRRGRNQNTLEPEHAATILEAYQAFTDTSGLAYVASLNEIKANGYNLSIPLYVEPADDRDEITLKQAVADLEAAHAAAAESRKALESELVKWGLGA